MPRLVPPQPAPLWTHTPEQIAQLTELTIQQLAAIYDNVASLTPDECTFESVFLHLAHADVVRARLEPIIFYRDVSPSKAVRDAANDAESAIDDFTVDAAMRLDVFTAKKAAQANILKSGVKLDKVEQRLVDRMLRDGVRNGLDLSAEKREQLVALKKDLAQACVEFRKNANEENGKLAFTLEELDGVPADEIAGFDKVTKGDKVFYEISHNGPDISTIWADAKSHDTRSRASESYDHRLAVNVPVLERVLELRRQIAALQGYSTWADYALEIKMAKNATNVMTLLDDLEQKLRPIGLKEREILLALKKADCEERGIPFDGTYTIVDYRYYIRMFSKKFLQLDSNKLKEYFPVSFLVPAILGIYQDLLSVRFEEIKPTTDGEVWHPDVQKFAVWEKDAKDESDFLGYCYLDIYPREGKFSHAAVFPLLPGYEISASESPSGKSMRSYPVTAMVANLSKPTPDKPALVGHFNVTTFFHEMGHAFHELLSRTRFARFHGTIGPVDFAEAPSQMLENWCWEPKILEKMSSHYETKEPLPQDLIAKLLKARYANVGLFYLRQVAYAKYDMKVHMDNEPHDYTKLWNETLDSISLTEPVPHPGPGQAAFGHLIGYDAGYYSYSYSNVFAVDMYRSVFKGDEMNPELGRRYRERVLLPGASKDELEILEDFLGRPPNVNAFVEQLMAGAAEQEKQHAERV